MRDRVEAVTMQTHQVDERLLIAALGRLDEVPIHPTVRELAPVGDAGPPVSVDRAPGSLENRRRMPKSRTRRLLNLALFAAIAVVVAVAAVVALRPVVQRATGVNVDIGSGGLAELVVPDEYEVSVFAEGFASPRFMDVSADGVLFVAERGADRVVALPDRDADGRADETIEVGRGFESAHSVAFEPDGSLLVAGETRLFRLGLDANLQEAGRSVVLDGLTTGGHSTRTVAVLPDGQLLLAAGSTCNVCVESDPRRAAISLVPSDGGSSRVYMTGLRNAVGVWVDPATGRAWATDMGRDWLGTTCRLRRSTR